MAGTLKVTAAVSVQGPLADGTADRVLQEWANNTAQALADQGVAALRAFPMDKTGRARSGFQDALKSRSRGPGITEIPGPMITGVTWAPWLEGTSKRNESTGFKGYKLFAKTRLQLQKQATQVGDAELAKLMPQIGGA
jgi:hypothetical protein